MPAVFEREMIVSDDENEFLASMYQDDDDDAPEGVAAPADASRPTSGIMSMPALTQAVRRLEMEAAAQRKLVAKLQSTIRHLTARNRRLEHGGRSAASHIDDIRSDLDNKIDRRDY